MSQVARKYMDVCPFHNYAPRQEISNSEDLGAAVIPSYGLKDRRIINEVNLSKLQGDLLKLQLKLSVIERFAY
jgi:hypothetical protein